MNWFKRAKEVVYKVIEIESRDAPLPKLTPEIKASLGTLVHSPAFVYLLHKLRYERALLEKYLREGFQLGENQLHHLQAGIHYLGYLDAEIKKLTSLPTAPTRDASEAEAETFERIRSSVSIIE